MRRPSTPGVSSDGAYVFRHALHRQVLYKRLDRLARVELHRRLKASLDRQQRERDLALRIVGIRGASTRSLPADRERSNRLPVPAVTRSGFADFCVARFTIPALTGPGRRSGGSAMSSADYGRRRRGGQRVTRFGPVLDDATDAQPKPRRTGTTMTTSSSTAAPPLRVRFDRFEIDEAEARLMDGGQAGAPRAQALRPPLRPGAGAAHADRQERAARRCVGPPVRQRVGAEDDDQRPAGSAAGRSQAAALHRNRVAPRLSVHRHGERGRESRR